jgi:hypothetical protein
LCFRTAAACLQFSAAASVIALGSPNAQRGKSTNCRSLDEHRLEIGAHIAAVPLNGQDSRRAEKTDCAKNQGFRDRPETVAGLHYQGCIQFRIKGVGLVSADPSTGKGPVRPSQEIMRAKDAQTRNDVPPGCPLFPVWVPPCSP